MNKVIKIKKYRSYTKKEDFEVFSIVRVRHIHVSRRLNSSTPDKIKSGSWIAITNDCDCGKCEGEGRKVYRIVRGLSSGEKSVLCEDAIEIDTDTVLDELCVEKAGPDPNGYYPCKLSIRPAKLWERFLAHWYHPDIQYRFPLRVATVLGAIAIGLGLVGLFR